MVRENGWICLQYLFFYFMNDYRSTFYGVNDHEADWEQVFIYLEDDPKGVRPVWIAAAAHDYTGDELRRRWDDPTLGKEGDHPVIYAGAGSHASYFEAGEYLTEVPIPALRGLGNFLEVLREFWRDTLRQPDPGDLRRALSSALSVPFVDYARGDGKTIGPGQAESWSPVLIDDTTDWVVGYRGLFGLDTHDRFAGERAPAGPRYTAHGHGAPVLERSSRLRRAGQDRTALPAARGDRAASHPALGRGRRHRRGGRRARTELPKLDLEVRSLAHSGSTQALHQERADELKRGELALSGLRARQASIADTLTALRQRAAPHRGGRPGRPPGPPAAPPPARAPRGDALQRHRRALVRDQRGRAAAVHRGADVLPHLVPWWAALLLGIAGYVVIEAALRRRLSILLLRLVLVLAVITAVLLIFDFRMELIVAAIAGLALIVAADNIREVSNR